MASQEEQPRQRHGRQLPEQSAKLLDLHEAVFEKDLPKVLDLYQAVLQELLDLHEAVPLEGQGQHVVRLLPQAEHLQYCRRLQGRLVRMRRDLRLRLWKVSDSGSAILV